MPLQYLAQVGVVHDADYAAAFARAAAYSKAWAPNRIRVELRRRGVEDADIDAALGAALGTPSNAHPDTIPACMTLLIERVDAAMDLGVHAALEAADEASDDTGAMRSAGIVGLQRVHKRGYINTGALLRAAHRRWTTTGNLALPKRTARLAGWLQRRGHGWDVTSSLLAALQRWEAS